MIKLPSTGSILLFSFILVAPLISKSQDEKKACGDLKKGIFYIYPKNSADHYIITRDGDMEHELNTVTGDSTVWQVKWVGDCRYTLKYLSGNLKMDDGTLATLKKHKLLYDIQNVTEDYYVFKGYFDKVSTIPIQSDTIWFNKKIYIADNSLFRQVEKDPFKKAHVKDTAKFAVLYIYRPGKFTNSKGNYIIYFDDNVMCIGKNNSGYIFKIFKKGQFEIKSKLFKDEAATKLDVKFGNSYYVRAGIRWTITSRLYNFKLQMAVVNPDIGKDEFENTDLQ